MLSGKSIREEIKQGRLLFDGSVRGNSLLLSLGGTLQVFKASESIVDPFDQLSVERSYEESLVNWGTYELHSSRAVLISAKEFIQLPGDLGGIIGTLSHVARLGMFCHFSSPLVGPRFAGRLCLEILNVSGHTIRLIEGAPVAKLILIRSEGEDPTTGSDAIPFFYNSSEAEKESDLRSKYYLEFKGHQDESD